MKRLLSALCCLIAVSPVWSQATCRSSEYRKQQLEASPALLLEVDKAEAFTNSQLSGRRTVVTGGSGGATGITIPVVVHILYHTPAENISNAQVQSQIDILNEDYQKRNPDSADIPFYYRTLAANCGFRFGLALADTNGQATSGIVRRYTDVTAFTINDGIKSDATGGDDGWDRDRYLNIWVGNLSGGILGYSSIVGGPKATDGVVVSYMAFGSIGTARAPFNRGRTTTHEVGHWLNLIHTWGDDSCGDDEVADTPPQQGPDYGDPGGIVISCGNAPYGNLYMDYMDFTDDAGMHLFTFGQRARMRSLFAPGGFRFPLLSSTVPVKIADSATGNSVLTGTHLLAFPNPAATQVTVQLPDPQFVGGVLEVYNAFGQKTTERRICSVLFQMDVSGWKSGVYFLRATAGVKRMVAELVKM
ncbi:MAG TPA: M43 family zinc metalloprotease [Puia sp.]|nr:M43 family zinc metalloprotease [Puia sp.]